MRALKTVMLCVFCAAIGHGQQVETLEVSVDNALINDVDIRNRGQNGPNVEEASDAMRAFLDVELDEIKRVCKPPKGQFANLNLAAKAAVEVAVEEWYGGAINATSVEAKKILHPDRNAAKNQRLWRSAVRDLLSAEQKELLQQHRAERLSRYPTKKKRTNAETIAIALDKQLLLGESQSRQLLVLIKGEVDEINISKRQIEFTKKFAKRYASFLTTAQKAKWKELSKKAYDEAWELKIK